MPVSSKNGTFVSGKQIGTNVEYKLGVGVKVTLSSVREGGVAERQPVHIPSPPSILPLALFWAMKPLIPPMRPFASQSSYPWMQLIFVRASHKRAPEEEGNAGATKRACEATRSLLQDAPLVAEEMAQGTGPQHADERGDDNLPSVMHLRSAHAEVPKERVRDNKRPQRLLSVPSSVQVVAAETQADACARLALVAALREAETEVECAKAGAAATSEREVRSSFRVPLVR